MPRPPAIPQPTNAELAILRVLWNEGECTVREVHERLPEREVGYTTVLKLMQIMVEKGLVRRNESSRSHVYRAALPEREAQRQLVTDLVDRAFEGSAASLVMHALENNLATAADLAEIRKLLDERSPRSAP
ncbi:MAG: BlaI/MecI/CopY family transcriptional regulator [Cytophagaceae bacterium]|nr:BlaI/MecI/CopY family transcriptional regulator [Gemmatimonadaceae bacterium]